MKKISILIPCYNEEESIDKMCHAIERLFYDKLSTYDYELIFIDNASVDGTRKKLRGLCAENHRVKAILNMRNFGQNNSPYYGLLQTTGDCSISMSCDFQDPVELIPRFIEEWEKGYKVVIAIKQSSKENIIFYHLRGMYYKILRKMSNIEPIEHFTGFGLYDKSFIDILRGLNDPIPFLRGVVAEFSNNRKEIFFEQPERKYGKTHNNWRTLYSIAMRSFTTYTRLGLRAMSIISFCLGTMSFLVGIVYFLLKLFNWYAFPGGSIPVLLAVLILGCFQLFFIGLLGEYIFSMNERLLNRPLVIEEERINF